MSNKAPIVTISVLALATFAIVIFASIASLGNKNKRRARLSVTIDAAGQQLNVDDEQQKRLAQVILRFASTAKTTVPFAPGVDAQQIWQNLKRSTFIEVRLPRSREFQVHGQSTAIRAFLIAFSNRGIGWPTQVLFEGRDGSVTQHSGWNATNARELVCDEFLSQYSPFSQACQQLPAFGTPGQLTPLRTTY